MVCTFWVNQKHKASVDYKLFMKHKNLSTYVPHQKKKRHKRMIRRGVFSAAFDCIPSERYIYHCSTIHRYRIFSRRYSVMCKVFTGYCGTSEIEHGLCACTVDNPLAKARGSSLRTGAQTMLYLSLVPQSKDTQSLARDTL